MAMNRFALALLFLIPGLACAAASPMQDASQLFRQGQHAQALEKVNGHLAGNPKDAQGRFLKGLILAELNRTQDAIKTFTDLADDFPELPEPYNNLAVLYASQGQFERAKHSLEMAIRTHPSYATAHENLGDIYAKMASVAYDKALQLDKSNTSAQMKLSLVKDIFTPAGLDKSKTAKTTNSKSAALSTPTPAATPEKKPSAVVVAAKTEEGKPEGTKPEPAKSDGSKSESKTDAVKADPSATASASTSAKPGNTSSQVEQTLLAWAGAWAKKDVPAYLSFYSPSFKLPGGMDRAGWEALRNQRITRASQIKVELSKIDIKADAKSAKATFSQLYESNILKGTTRKTMLLENIDGNWKIVEEK